ncbi:alpha/beta fold hydrolase [Pseudonocardia lacus]|uniref:alpha/beta fold hydrolase n=1 Tax=Pseudonocardia lacus TaxID=2835865 RepID=UPI001BDC078D|nr:alpha/beta fold hydrolase [Pseudonocardia lacus]
MTESVVAVDGVDLCIEEFGDAADPPLLLIAGGGQSMVWWDREFCARLAAGGRHVVRYDHRDTGRSTTTPAGRPTYTFADLATDPLRLLDHLGVERAHMVGMSLGGGIVQHLAVEHADRVASLVLIASSPAGPGGADSGLPPMSPAVAATFADPDPEPDWTDREAVIAYRIAVERPYVGTLGFDEQRVRRLSTLEVDRTTDMAASLTNHFVLEGGWSGRRHLSGISAPALVLHGTADPLLPLPHGRALAREIPGARLVTLPGVGHEIPPPPLWDLVVSEVLAVTALA